MPKWRFGHSFARFRVLAVAAWARMAQRLTAAMPSKTRLLSIKAVNQMLTAGLLLPSRRRLRATVRRCIVSRRNRAAVLFSGRFAIASGWKVKDVRGWKPPPHPSLVVSGVAGSAACGCVVGGCWFVVLFVKPSIFFPKLLTIYFWIGATMQLYLWYKTKRYEND